VVSCWKFRVLSVCQQGALGAVSHSYILSRVLSSILINEGLGERIAEHIVHSRGYVI
jgi:hypothetical protein